MKLLAVVCFAILLVHGAKATEFVYKFGTDIGNVVHVAEGNIPLLQYHTDVDIPVPAGITETYVEVTVNALSAPKVDYDVLFHKVVIDYTWVQVPISSYKVIVKGV